MLERTLFSSEQIVIIGLGPVGLCAALTACQKDRFHRKVIAITDRLSYTRNQFLILAPETLEYLATLVGKTALNHFQNQYVYHEQTSRGCLQVVTIKTLETFLYTELMKQKNIEIIHAPKHDFIQTIDETRHILTLTSKTQPNLNREINFKYLIAADGAHHHSADQIKTCHYDPMDVLQDCQQHTWGLYDLPQGFRNLSYQNHLKEEIRHLDESKNLDAFIPFGWRFNAIPEAIVLIHGNQLSVGCECPDDLNTSQADAWMRVVLTSYLPKEDIHDLDLNACARFETLLDETKQCLVALPQQTYFLVCGDALQKQHYLTGIGTLTGIRQTQFLGNFLASPQLPQHLNAYQHDIETIQANGRKHINDYLNMRHLKLTDKYRAMAIDAQAETDLPAKRHGCP